jgi:hypothetical protein
MPTGATGQLGLALPVQGELSGTWGDTVNNGLTQYANIAIAATLTLTNDGAVTLQNTTGDATASNITSTLTGAGTVTAQFAIVQVTGTLTTTKIVTAPSYSKTYVVDNAATGGTVTFKASGQPGVSIAVGEKCTVYYNGSDYVKVASSSVGTVTSVAGTGTVNGITLTGTVTSTGSLTLGGTLANVNLTSQVTGTLPAANGGTGITSAGTAGNVLTSTGSAWVSSAPATGLPSQVGNAGKYLTTDGSSASWTETGAAANGSIYVNNTLISSNYTIASGQNGFSVGPITQAPGVTVTITAGQRWVVL